MAKADIIATDRATGALTIWLTSWKGQKFFFFNKISSGTSYCKEGWGVGVLDIGPRFSDLTGNGCVDYLCMEPDGRTTGYLNSCSKDVKLTDAGQVKFAEKQKDRTNFRFVDVDDYLWVNNFRGDATVWYSCGRASASGNSGSSFKWENQGKAYSGSSRGANMHYPNLGGVARADMVHVDPDTAFGWVWYNTCPGGGGDDGEWSLEIQNSHSSSQNPFTTNLGAMGWRMIQQTVMRTVLMEIGGAVTQLNPAVALFDEFIPARYQYVTRLRRDWLRRLLLATRDRVNEEIRVGNRVPGAQQFTGNINYTISRLDDMVSPPIDGTEILRGEYWVLDRQTDA
ncbi:hypothetical protein F52700_7994 [Fusarium sp. NRRL 52700]|nr:hypothetical protein F52700_7994 [Fusarium sp. NRRL 52700]